MEDKRKINELFLITATVIGFAYSIMMLISFWILMGINFSDIHIVEIIKDDRIKWLLLLLLIIIAVIAPPIINLIGWKKNSKKMVIAAIILYFLSLNALSLFICVIGIFWDSNNELGIQEKKKNPLLLIAGILGILGLVYWFLPLMQRTDGSGSDSLISSLLSYVMNSNEILLVKIMAIYYFITLLASFIIAIPICLFNKLRNNSKKALIAAISYIISLSIPSSILCFIAFAKMKKTNKEQ